MNIYEEIIKSKQNRKSSILVTVVKKEGAGPLDVNKKMLVTEDNKSFGTVGGGAIEYEARENCKKIFKNKESLLENYIFKEDKIIKGAKTLEMECGGSATLFYEYIGVKAYIYIFGAGHVGQALIKILKTMDYYITVIDERKEVIESFDGVDRKVNMAFSKFIDFEGIKDDSYVIVCTPSHKNDYNVIHKILELNLQPKYIGMLCSEEKLKDYLEKTYQMYGKKVDLDNFYSPIGLNLGGNSPEEIAISITAEILTIQNNKTNHNHMRGNY